jgi:4-hydroxybenzoate polyprenyl transferase
MERLKLYGRLMRMDKRAGIWLLWAPTFWALCLASSGHIGFKWIILFSLGVVLTRAGGCVINDVFDADIDGAVARTENRVLATGEVSRKEAIILAFILFIFAFLCILPMGKFAIGLSFIALFLALTYPLLKRFFPIPQLYLGLAFSFGIPIAYAAILGRVPASAWLLYAANIAWTLAYDTLYAVSDKEDDLHLNIYSSAITWGNYDVIGAFCCYGIFLVIMLCVGFVYHLNLIYWLAWILVLVGIAYQYPKVKNKDRNANYQAFLQNTHFGFIFFMGIFLALYWKG